MYDIIEKIGYTGITHKEAAFNFYMPIKKLSASSTTHKNFIKNGNKRTVIKKYGKMEIRNRLLTEYHHKIIMAIIRFGNSSACSKGTIITYFREVDILKDLNMGIKNYVALRESIKTIADSQYYITVGTFTRKVGIFQEHLISDTKHNKMQAVEFNEEYVKMHKSDFSASNKEIFSKISLIPYSTIPSIIHCIMFKNKTDKLMTFPLHEILEEIGFPTDTPNSMREIKTNLKKYKDKLLSDYNIEYDYDTKMLTYRKMQSLVFIRELATTIEELNNYIGMIFMYENKDYIISSIDSINEDNTKWVIKTETKKIEFEYFLDDFLFFLSRTTKIKLENNLEDLFSLTSGIKKRD